MAARKRAANGEEEGVLARNHRRVGWTLLFVALLFGTTVEGLLGFKAAALLLDPIRREFWGLAHFHGASLALLNLVYVPWADRLAPSLRQRASASLIAGSLLLPLGFFLGGAVHPEGDPGIGILLVPLGALLLLYPIALHAIAAWRA